MRRTSKHSIIFIGLIVALLLTPIWAYAVIDTTSFDLGLGNTAISGYTGPYAHVEVDLNTTTTATITFTSLTNSGNIYLMGDGGSVDVNVNATTWTLSNITGSNAGTGFTPGPYSDGGAANAINGFGSFNQTIDSFDGFTHSSDMITFDLTNTSGTWTDALSVLAANDHDAAAAAHIFVTSSPANAKNGALATGFATGNEGGGPPPFETPEPSTIILIGAGLLSLGLRGRKWMQK
ncbi:hypothetical protein NBG4_10011 [Candidatus Sulfobium mesophilum]|uniref:Ice-binding protein C-terminal domain-containing protein n=1 Tax=Candidatus Sulfobium mesophilum TaxID=2016548 RepID=A0A2U3QDI9_9BACT|nr:hypothetical protein NBG4_10011 [Candidatus Sulfobium mesophilum]